MIDLWISWNILMGFFAFLKEKRQGILTGTPFLHRVKKELSQEGLSHEFLGFTDYVCRINASPPSFGWGRAFSICKTWNGKMVFHPFHCTKFSHECSPTFKTTLSKGKKKNQKNNHFSTLKKSTKCHQTMYSNSFQKSAIWIKAKKNPRGKCLRFGDFYKYTLQKSRNKN